MKRFYLDLASSACPDFPDLKRMETLKNMSPLVKNVERKGRGGVMSRARVHLEESSQKRGGCVVPAGEDLVEGPDLAFPAGCGRMLAFSPVPGLPGPGYGRSRPI